MRLDIEQNGSVIDAEAAPTCYLCGRHGEILYRDLEDRLFGASGSWTLKQCPDADCNLVWLDPMPTKEQLQPTLNALASSWRKVRGIEKQR